jgi:phage N-6-adenine-methyltransferase
MSKRMRVHHSTGNNDWRTPRAFFDPLRREFNIKVDLAADRTNHLCPIWFGPGHRSKYRRNTLALTADRTHPYQWAWCNPPYSRALQKEFVKVCAERGRVVMLLPARTDTATFHRYIWDAKRQRARRNVEVRFVKGRIKFVGAKDPAPFPSMVVIFR